MTRAQWRPAPRARHLRVEDIDPVGSFLDRLLARFRPRPRATITRPTSAEYLQSRHGANFSVSLPSGLECTPQAGPCPAVPASSGCGGDFLEAPIGDANVND